MTARKPRPTSSRRCSQPWTSTRACCTVRSFGTTGSSLEGAAAEVRHSAGPGPPGPPDPIVSSAMTLVKGAPPVASAEEFNVRLQGTILPILPPGPPRDSGAAASRRRPGSSRRRATLPGSEHGNSRKSPPRRERPEGWPAERLGRRVPLSRAGVRTGSPAVVMPPLGQGGGVTPAAVSASRGSPKTLAVVLHRSHPINEGGRGSPAPHLEL